MTMLEVLPVISAGREVLIDGYRVPRLTTEEDAATGMWRVCYDNRFSIMATLEEMQRWVWLLAQVQAVGEGYSCHGENSVYRPNPHQVKVMQIGSVEAIPTGTQEG